jgi:hypothetical protein
MKARILIVTAGAIAALTAGSAGAMIPADGGSHLGLSGKAVHIVKAKHSLKQQLGGSDTSIKVGAYATHAYVHGGASDKVAMAITRLGKKLGNPNEGQGALPCICISGPSTPPQPAAALDDEQNCLVNNICTDEQNCAIWGLNCNLVENPALVGGGQATETVQTNTPVG